jgi:hypothetical protein
MKRAFLLLLVLVLQPVPCRAAIGWPQSLAEAARREAERRKGIEQKGVPSKRIDSSDVTPAPSGGTVSLSSPVSGSATNSAGTVRMEPRPALRTFQSQLQKLDREIAQADEKLKLLRARVEAERWAPVRTTKGSIGSVIPSSLEQLRRQVGDLERKLATLRKERADVFLAGRKAGYLPGELENRGIIR